MKNRNTGLLPLAIVVVCGLILAGCGESGDTPPAAAPSEKTGSAPAAKPESRTAPAPTPAAKPDSGTAPVTTPAAKPAAKAAAVVAKHPWGSFKVGSYAKTKSVTKMEMAGIDPTETVMEMTMTLVALDAENATLKTQMKSADTEMPVTETKVPLKAAGVAVAEQKVAEAKVKELGSGSETIEVAGKKLGCKWVQTEMETDGNKIINKVWQCDDVPGFTVKMVSTMTGVMKSTTTSEVVDFAAK